MKENKTFGICNRIAINISHSLLFSQLRPLIMKCVRNAHVQRLEILGKEWKNQVRTPPEVVHIPSVVITEKEQPTSLPQFVLDFLLEGVLQSFAYLHLCWNLLQKCELHGSFILSPVTDLEKKINLNNLICLMSIS